MDDSKRLDDLQHLCLPFLCCKCNNFGSIVLFSSPYSVYPNLTLAHVTEGFYCVQYFDRLTVHPLSVEYISSTIGNLLGNEFTLTQFLRGLFGSPELLDFTVPTTWIPRCLHKLVIQLSVTRCAPCDGTFLAPIAHGMGRQWQKCPEVEFQLSFDTFWTIIQTVGFQMPFLRLLWVVNSATMSSLPRYSLFVNM